jgi:hypothetical protein
MKQVKLLQVDVCLATHAENGYIDHLSMSADHSPLSKPAHNSNLIHLHIQ